MQKEVNSAVSTATGGKSPEQRGRGPPRSSRSEGSAQARILWFPCAGDTAMWLGRKVVPDARPSRSVTKTLTSSRGQRPKAQAGSQENCAPDPAASWASWGGAAPPGSRTLSACSDVRLMASGPRRCRLAGPLSHTLRAAGTRRGTFLRMSRREAERRKR